MSDSEEEGSEKQFKIVLVGNSQTGKTAICQRYSTNQYTKQYHPTTGVDFYLKRTTIAGTKNIALKLWDVSGQSLAGRMTDKYIFGANVVMLVYDVTNSASFEDLQDWLDLCRKALGGEEKPPLFALVANKVDLEHLRSIKSEKHHKFAQDNGLLTYAVSAKTGEGVALCLQKIAAELLGIRLSKQEQEQHGAVVKAEIVSYPQENHLRNPQTSSTSSAVCSVM